TRRLTLPYLRSRRRHYNRIAKQMPRGTLQATQQPLCLSNHRIQINQELMLCEAQTVTVSELGLLDGLVIDKGTVSAAEVFDQHAVRLHEDLAMYLGNVDCPHNNVAVCRATKNRFLTSDVDSLAGGRRHQAHA